MLPDPATRPGGTLHGEVRLAGGDHDVLIDHIVLGLVTRVEAGGRRARLLRVPPGVRSPATSRLAAGARQDLPFTARVPWETPVTHCTASRCAA